MANRLIIQWKLFYEFFSFFICWIKKWEWIWDVMVSLHWKASKYIPSLMYYIYFLYTLIYTFCDVNMQYVMYFELTTFRKNHLWKSQKIEFMQRLILPNEPFYGHFSKIYFQESTILTFFAVPVIRTTQPNCLKKLPMVQSPSVQRPGIQGSNVQLPKIQASRVQAYSGPESKHPEFRCPIVQSLFIQSPSVQASRVHASRCPESKRP